MNLKQLAEEYFQAQAGKAEELAKSLVGAFEDKPELTVITAVAVLSRTLEEAGTPKEVAYSKEVFTLAAALCFACKELAAAKEEKQTKSSLAE